MGRCGYSVSSQSWRRALRRTRLPGNPSESHREIWPAIAACWKPHTGSAESELTIVTASAAARFWAGRGSPIRNAARRRRSAHFRRQSWRPGGKESAAGYELSRQDRPSRHCWYRHRHGVALGKSTNVFGKTALGKDVHRGAGSCRAYRLVGSHFLRIFRSHERQLEASGPGRQYRPTS